MSPKLSFDVWRLIDKLKFIGHSMNDMKRLILITIAISIALASVSAIKASEITITGKLQKTVEAGGWLIVGKSKLPVDQLQQISKRVVV
jgi:hypothetical protein